MSEYDDLVDEFKRRFPERKAFTAIRATIQASLESSDMSRPIATDIARELVRQMIQTMLDHAPQSVCDELRTIIQARIEKN